MTFSTNSNYASNDVFHDYIESEIDLIIHVLKHEVNKELCDIYKSREIIKEKRASEDGREFVNKLVDDAFSLANSETSSWSLEFKKLHNKKNRKIDICIDRNIKMVHYHAQKWHSSFKGKVSYDDLVQEAMIGLYKAVTKYNPDLGFKFYTYAVWWVRQSLQRFTDDNLEIIRMPYALVNQLKNVKKLHTKHVSENGKSYLEDYINENKIDIPIGVLTSIKTMSLDVPLISDSSITLADTLVSEDVSPSDMMATTEINEVIKEVLEYLDEKEKRIILSRFGLYGTQALSLREIGESMNLSKERVRQLEELCFRKIKIKVKNGCSKKAKEVFSNAAKEWS